MNLDPSQLKDIASTSAFRTELWNRILKMEKIKTMAEVGVWKGDFTRDILEQSDFIDRYYMIDPWANLPDWNKPFNVRQEMFDDIYAEAIAKTAFASNKITVLRGRTAEVISAIPDKSLDFAYIDGDHTLRGITVDLIKLLPKIKDGGIIGGDDFSNNPWQHEARFEPTLVCPFSVYFAEAMNLPFTALPFDQFLIHKAEGASFSFTDTTGNYKDLSLNKSPAKARSRLKRALELMGISKL